MTPAFLWDPSPVSLSAFMSSSAGWRWETDSKGALLGVNGFFSWPPFPGQSQGYSTLGGCPASLPSIGPISALSAPRSKPQLWSHRVEEHLRKVGSQG